MKIIVVFLLVTFTISDGAPTPDPIPRPIAAPEPKPNPSVLLTASSAVVTSPVVTYSHYIKAPLYHTFSPYVYNLGYASDYSYSAYPYYVPVHIL